MGEYFRLCIQNDIQCAVFLLEVGRQDLTWGFQHDGTHKFEVFELKDLKDLPTPKEIEELSRSRLEENPDAYDQVEDHPPASHIPVDVPEADNHADNQD